MGNEVYLDAVTRRGLSDGKTSSAELQVGTFNKYTNLSAILATMKGAAGKYFHNFSFYEHNLLICGYDSEVSASKYLAEILIEAILAKLAGTKSRNLDQNNLNK